MKDIIIAFIIIFGVLALISGVLLMHFLTKKSKQNARNAGIVFSASLVVLLILFLFNYNFTFLQPTENTINYDI